MNKATWIVITQEMETRRGFQELVVEHNPDLFAFRNAKNLLIDTTDITMVETFNQSIAFLDALGIGNK